MPRRTSAAIAVAFVLLAVAVVVAVPLAAGGSKTTTGNSASGKPVAGGVYKYEKVFAKDPSPKWNLPGGKRNFATVRVSRDGTSLTVAWGLVASTGCVGRNYGGKVEAEPGGDLIEQVAITPSGTFHGIYTRKPSWHLRYWRSEAYGVFAPDGKYVDLRVRSKLYSIKDSSNWHRCDGRWVRFRAPLQGGKQLAAPEEGRYEGKVDGTSPISFTVAQGASGHVFMQNLQLKVQLQCFEGSPTREVTERIAAPWPITGSRIKAARLSDSGVDYVSMNASLSGRSASGSLRVQHAGCSSAPHPWSAEAKTP